MKKLILFLSVLVAFNINVFAEDDESSSEPAKKKSEACENEEARNAFFLIKSHSKEEIQQRITETRQTIDQCESNEEGESLNKQIAQMEEKLKGAPAEGTVADKKENPKDYTYGDFGEAPKKLAVDEKPAAPVASASDAEGAKATPAAAPAPEKKAVVAKPKAPAQQASGTAYVDEFGATVDPSKKASTPQAVIKPPVPVKSNERELVEDIGRRAGNVAVNVGTTTVDVSKALVDPKYYEAVGDRVGELKDKAVAGVKSLTAPSTGPKDERPLSSRAAETARSVGGFLSDKESWKAMANNTWNVATGMWNNSAGKVYDGAKVLADGRNDTSTNLQAMNDIAAGSVSTVVNGTGVVNGARAAGAKAVQYFRNSAGQTIEVTTSATGEVTQKVVRNVTEKASDQAMGNVNSRAPASTGGGR